MVAVTGANGLLGSFIVRKLIDTGTPFIALKREDSDTSLLGDVASEITWRKADVLDTVQLTQALHGVTKVIHTAAIVSYNPRKARQVMQINAEGTRNVVNECLSQGIQRLVHISSVAALGRQKNQKVIDETNQWVDNPMNTVYATSKYLAELEVFRGQEEGLSTVVVNPSVILAPADWNRSSAKLFRYVWDEKSFYTDGSLNWVDVRDVADITYRLLDSTISGERFILNAGKVTFHQFFTKVAAAFGRRAPGINLGAGLLRLAARAEVVRTLFSGSEPLITLETARLAGTDFFFDNQKVRKSLGVDFQPIDASIGWCCAFYRKKFGDKN